MINADMENLIRTMLFSRRVVAGFYSILFDLEAGFLYRYGQLLSRKVLTPRTHIRVLASSKLEYMDGTISSEDRMNPLFGAFGRFAFV